MEFAKSQLEKHGWSEGKGLGRDEMGMKDAIKVKFKFDTTGVGHNPADQFTYHWWSQAFDQAAKSITVKQSQDGVNVNTTNNQMLSTRKPLGKGMAGKDLLYGRFVKSTTLLNGDLGEASPVSSSDSEDGDADPENRFKQVTDEDLFRLCEGRTAHKGARHGLKASAKLSRVEEQEAAFMAKWASPAATETDKVKSKEHKKSKCKEDPEDAPSPAASLPDRKSKHRKHKKAKAEDLGEENSNSSGYLSDADKAKGSAGVDGENGVGSSKKRKKKKKKNKEVEDVDEDVDSLQIVENGEDLEKTELDVGSEDVEKRKKKKKKSKNGEQCDEVIADSNVGHSDRKRKRKRTQKDNCSEIVNLVETSRSDESTKSKKRMKSKK